MKKRLLKNINGLNWDLENKMNKDNLKIIGIFIVAILLAIVFWNMGRYVNYNLSYKDMVQKEIKMALIPYEKRITELENKLEE